MTSQLAELGSIFLGIGGMFFMFVLSYMFYQISRFTKTEADTDMRYGIFEQMILSQIAKKKGYDIEKEIMERPLRMNKSFRGMVREQMIRETFPERLASKHSEK
jgi:hypothetical protein